MSEKFKPGDLVQLKSGSPIMTVDGYQQQPLGLMSSETRPTTKVNVVFFDSTGKEQRCRFEEDTLDLA